MGPVVGFFGAVFFGAAAGASAAYVLAVNLTRLALLSLAAKLTAPKIDLTQSAVDKLLTVRSSVQPQAFVYGQDMLSGPLVFANTAGEGNADLHRLVALTGREIESFEGFRIDDTDIEIGTDIAGANHPVTGGDFADVMEIATELGTSTQTALSELTSAFSDLWTAAHRARGWSLFYTKMSLVGNNTAYEGGIPQNLRGLIKGHKVYDPRLDDTNGGTGAHRLADETTWEWSNNPALCLADWLRWDEVGLGEPDARIDWSLCAAAADICEQSVDIPTAATQNRYTCNFTFYADQPREQIKEILDTAMLGRSIFSQGKWRMWAGAALTSTVTLDEDNLRGAIQIEASTPGKDRYNRVRGKFIDPTRNYSANAYPEQENSAYETADNGLKPKTFDFNACNNSFEAQRNAIIKLRQSRLQKVVVFEGNWSCFSVQPGKVVSVSNSEAGWSAKKFFVTGWELDKSGAGVNLFMVEEDDTVWADPDEGDYTVRDPTGDLIFPGPTSEVKLSSANIHNIAGSSCTAGMRAGLDGQMYYATAPGNFTTAGVPENEWLGTGGREYWLKATVNSGALDVGTIGSIIPLSLNRTYTITQSTPGVKSANVTLEIFADSAGADLLATGTFDLKATYEAAIEFVGAGTWLTADTQLTDEPVPAPGGIAAGDSLFVMAMGTSIDAREPNETTEWTDESVNGMGWLRLWHRTATGDANDDFTITTTGDDSVVAQMAAFRDPAGAGFTKHANSSAIDRTDQVNLPYNQLAAPGSTVSDVVQMIVAMKLFADEHAPGSVVNTSGLTEIGKIDYVSTAGAGSDYVAGWYYEVKDEGDEVPAGVLTFTGTDEPTRSVCSQVFRFRLL